MPSPEEQIPQMSDRDTFGTKSYFGVVPTNQITMTEINNVLELQKSFLRTGNIEDDKNGGRYLSTMTTVGQIEELLKTDGLTYVIDTRTGKLAGYSIVSTFDQAKGNPSESNFMNELENVTYQGQKFKKEEIMIWDQLCVDKEYQKGRVPLDIFREVRNRFAEKYKYILGRIGNDNPNSLNLAMDHLNFDQIGSYVEDGRSLSVILHEFKGEKKKVERKYERYARSYDIIGKVFIPYLELKSAHVDNIIDCTRENDWVLDFGTGTGNCAFDILKQDRNVVALDINEKMLNYAQQKLSQFNPDSYQIIPKDIFDTELKGDYFAAINALNVLYHLKTGSHERYISEFFRVMLPGGQLLVSGPHTDTNSEKLKDFILRNMSKDDQVRYKEHLDIVIESQKSLVEDPNRQTISGDDLVKIMEAAGFQIVGKSNGFYQGLNYFIIAKKPE
jgi:ubiquinone/menaquinone biosynthesis C-methylase UbiE